MQAIVFIFPDMYCVLEFIHTVS